MAVVDVHNYSPSPHRLPTQSVSDALNDLTSQRPLSTGLATLDSLLQPRGASVLDGFGSRSNGNSNSSSGSLAAGGIPRGQITEIYGPPGAGKTALAMQVAAKTLLHGDGVVWIDTSYNMIAQRLQEMAPSSSVLQGEQWDKFTHYHVPTLAHLFALLKAPATAFPPSRSTALVVIDCLSVLPALAFPKDYDSDRSKTQAAAGGKDTPHKSAVAAETQQKHWAANRRWAVMGDLVARLGKLAATANLAVLVLSQTVTRVGVKSGEATLHSALSSQTWDRGVATRIELSQDWALTTSNEDGESRVYGRGVIRAARLVGGNRHGHSPGMAQRSAAVHFILDKNGLREIQRPRDLSLERRQPLITPVRPVPTFTAPSTTATLAVPTPSRKRRRLNEVADSESDFDSDDDDDDDDDEIIEIQGVQPDQAAVQQAEAQGAAAEAAAAEEEDSEPEFGWTATDAVDLIRASQRTQYQHT